MIPERAEISKASPVFPSVFVEAFSRFQGTEGKYRECISPGGVMQNGGDADQSSRRLRHLKSAVQSIRKQLRRKRGPEIHRGAHLHLRLWTNLCIHSVKFHGPGKESAGEEQ